MGLSIMNVSHYLRVGLGCGLVVALGLTLSGCSSSGYGTSSFGNTNAKIAELSADAALTPTDALAQGRGHFRSNDFGYSAAYFKKAVEMAPHNPEGYVGLGASYDRLGRFDLSDRVYAALVKLTGPSVQYYNNIGYSMMLRGDLKHALTYFHKAEALDPDNIVIANNIQLLTDAAARAGA